MSEVTESKPYNWTTEYYRYAVICYTENTRYKLHITITDITSCEIVTIHKSAWKQIGDKMDVIVNGLCNNGDHNDLRMWNQIFYDMHAKFGIGYVFDVKSPLFARFYTNSRNEEFVGVDLEGFGMNNEIWLSCNTNMEMKIIMLELHNNGDLQQPLSYEAEYSGYWTPFADSSDPEREHRIIENEVHKWAYKQIKQFYLQTHGKEISMTLHTFSQSLIKLIIDYVI